MPAEALAEAIRPQWAPAAPAGVRALMSTRQGGVSQPPFDSLNLRPALLGGEQVDDAQAVAENQRRFATALGARPVWLRQVHGTRVLRLRPELARPDAPLETADASISTEPGLACTVMAADCLPVLLASRCGRVVGAAHAGWRGLSAGVLEATVAAMGEAAGVAPAELQAWLGPCIGPQAFEVGAEVLQAFGAAPEPVSDALFRYTPRPDGSPRWHADLAALARRRLQALGLPAQAIGGNDGAAQWCTVGQASRFFSFRRQPVSGRLAAAIARAG